MRNEVGHREEIVRGNAGNWEPGQAGRGREGKEIVAKRRGRLT